MSDPINDDENDVVDDVFVDEDDDDHDIVDAVLIDVYVDDDDVDGYDDVMYDVLNVEYEDCNEDDDQDDVDVPYGIDDDDNGNVDVHNDDACHNTSRY